MTGELIADRDFINRLKTDPANVAAQLVALTKVSEWARGMHRDNFDNYLLAAAELLEEQTPGTPRSSDDGEVERAVQRALTAMKALRTDHLPTLEELARAAIAAQVTK